MGWISPSLEWLIDSWAVVMTAAAFFYNYVFNKRNSHLLAASFSVAAIYCIGHFCLDWINQIPHELRNEYRYSTRLILYFIGVMILSLFTKRIGASFVTYMTLGVFCFAMVLQLALHIDRNVIALNQLTLYFNDGVVVVNRNFKDGYWALWDFYTNALNATSVIFVLYFLIGEKVKEYLCSLRY